MIFDKNYRKIRHLDDVMIDGELHKCNDINNTCEFTSQSGIIVIHKSDIPITKDNYEIVSKDEDCENVFDL